MDALILAAGLGSRMNELTTNTPKPLLKIRNQTLLEYAIKMTDKVSLNNIYINSHYLADQLHDYVNRHFPHLKISYEENILGTGGGIKKIYTDDMLVVNTDNLWSLNFTKEINQGIKFFHQHKEIENLLFTRSQGSRPDVEIIDKQLIQFPSDYPNTQFQGCHIVRKGVLDAYPHIFNIQDYWKNASLNKSLYGFETSTHNQHVGTKDLYLQYQN
jgi:MurNAc alpha-1-phosphate uridylyltransferase